MAVVWMLICIYESHSSALYTFTWTKVPLISVEFPFKRVYVAYKHCVYYTAYELLSTLDIYITVDLWSGPYVLQSPKTSTLGLEQYRGNTVLS